jgi:hypothetical protein
MVWEKVCIMDIGISIESHLRRTTEEREREEKPSLTFNKIGLMPISSLRSSSLSKN